MESAFITLTRSLCGQRVGGVVVERSAYVPQSQSVAFDVESCGFIDEFPLVERDSAPFIGTDRHQPDDARQTRRDQGSDHSSPFQLYSINHDCLDQLTSETSMFPFLCSYQCVVCP